MKKTKKRRPGQPRPLRTSDLERAQGGSHVPDGKEIIIDWQN